MQKKQVLSLILISAIIVLAWYGLVAYLQSTHPEWFRQPQPEQPKPTTQTVPAAIPTTAQAAGAPAATTQPHIPGGEPRALSAASPSPQRIGDPELDLKGKSEYPLALQIDPRGAGLKQVILNRYRAQVKGKEPYAYQQPDPKAPSWASVALAARDIQIDDGAWIDISDAIWHPTAPATQDSATYALDIVAGEGAATSRILTLYKTYSLKKRTDPSQGLEVSLTYGFVSYGKDRTVRLSFNGPNVPPVENTRDIPEVVVGYQDKNAISFDHWSGAEFHPANEKRPQDSASSLADPKKKPIVWAGITSAYFNSIVLAEDPAQLSDVRVFAAARPDEISGQEYLVLTFVTDKLTVPAAAVGTTRPTTQSTTRPTTQPASGDQLTAAATARLPLQVYFGPRQREILKSEYYAAPPRSYDETIVIKGKGFWGTICAACTWGWLINFLVWVLNGFHFVLFDWGLAIILLVVIVRLLLHPITKKSQVAMQKMTKLGPEVEKLKKKFGDDKEGLNRAMMELYKEQGITPILGCLPMFLQMPIWIALWSALQGTFELRHSSFLWGFTWIKDLAQPDRLLYFPNNFKLWFFHVDGLNVLPILMGVVFWLQQKMTPKPAAETPEQRQQRKMMTWMSLLFPVILYNGPAGLNLYILASTAIGIWESKRVRDHIKAQEEAEKGGKVIVDAKPTRASRRVSQTQPTQQAAPKGCLAGWLADLQKRAEEMRSEQAQKKKKPKR